MAITLIIIGNFTLNWTWPTFYNYIPVYKIWIQYTNLLKRYQMENIFPTREDEVEKRATSIIKIGGFYPKIELDLYFMIMYLCQNMNLIH